MSRPLPRSTPDRLVLWDIDGTLIRAGAVAREAFDRAVERALGRHPGDHGVQMSGKTDPQIAREILTLAGVAAAELDGHVVTVVGNLEHELARAEALLREGGRVLPGVEAVLDRLAAEPSVVQTVLTGNTAANAAVKLAAFGLERWLDVEIGAFGSDSADRLDLVPVATDRARRALGVEPGTAWPRSVWVVGDTPHDLACARAGGARCLLVATGRIPRGELEAAGADAVAADLSDVDGAVRLLLS